MALMKFCAKCKARVPMGTTYCTTHQEAYDKRLSAAAVLSDARRGSATERGYDARWQRARKRYLQSHPLCIECMRKGKLTPAIVVDHVVPHRGDYQLFWDETNWQPLCKLHHDRKTGSGR